MLRLWEALWITVRAFLGGCCGSYDAHIAALSAVSREKSPRLPSPLTTAVAASQTRVVDVTDSTVMIEKQINDDLLDSMDEVINAGGNLMKLHIRDESDIDTVDECQYGLSIPLCVSFEDNALKHSFMSIYNGKPYIM